MSARYGNFAAPANQAESVTKSTGVLFEASRALYVGVAGDVSVRMAGPSPANGGASGYVEFIGVPAGAILPVSVIEVRSESTTASSIVRLY